LSIKEANKLSAAPSPVQLSDLLGHLREQK